jgi:hypothetical protein
VTIFRHFPDKGNGGTAVDPVFTFITDAAAIFDADRKALLVKFIQDSEAGLDYSHGQADSW